MNRQVPHIYLIIGRGRLARHLIAYFNFENIPFKQWHRDNNPQLLRDLCQECDKVLLAISDREIEGFVIKNSIPQSKAIHFSGALTTPHAEKLHPLMSFAESTYSLDDYRQIPFVGVKGRAALKDLLPELQNAFFQIEAEQFALYHALCVLGGNGSVVLWQNVLAAFEKSLGLPREVLTPYISRIFQNIVENPDRALTGPWIRQDVSTIEKNKSALRSPFEPSTLLNMYESLSESLLPRSTP